METDYLIVGSGLAALSFGALMAKTGKKVKILEAHYLPGGYGHTFELGGYKFNAQLHYVWNCGEGRTVYNMLDALGLVDEISFVEYDANGFDRMRMDGYALDIPYDFEELIRRLQALFPESADNIQRFISEVHGISQALDMLPDLFSLEGLRQLKAQGKLTHIPKIGSIIKFRNATLQDVFDHFKLPQAAQTLIGLQWPDFMLPPNQLSFFAWLLLFTGYCRGAYYPGRHFEHFVNSLVNLIEENGGEILYEHKAVEFVTEGQRMAAVVAENLKTGQISEHHAPTVVCNMDPRKAAEMIGFEKFAPKIRKQLNYDYSYSNFMAYCVVEGIDLRDYGFGKSNLFHTEQIDLNCAFNDMYWRGDYSKPSFAVTVPSLLTDDRSDCPPGHQIVEFLTVANYDRFLNLKLSSPAAYRRKKQEILDAILDVMEAHYVPNLRQHLVFKVTGSPTTSERYCWSPAGNSYGSNMIPKNIGLGRLTHRTSFDNFYFCNASSGYAGFAGTIWTGCRLYERLSGDKIL
ncbi:MAG: NAD(P)/FAD-dependent oxidoreductase [Chloroflexi bacterium]|nr:NAD(P)/FAD-dependent oxidoreductase [Chloroflexota bacterium]